MGFLGVLTYKVRFVDISGLIAAFVVGFTVWAAGGPPAFVVLLFFFISAGIATKYKYKAKAKKDLAQEGKGRRSGRMSSEAASSQCFSPSAFNLRRNQ